MLLFSFTLHGYASQLRRKEFSLSFPARRQHGRARQNEECSAKRSGIRMSKLKPRIHQLDSSFRISAEGEFNGISESVLELIYWLAPVSELSC